MTLPLPEPCYHDEQATFFLGDTQNILSAMPHRSVDCIVTSPPYWRRRDYGSLRQLGHDPTAAACTERRRESATAAPISPETVTATETGTRAGQRRLG
jgi:hypothetical protein